MAHGFDVVNVVTISIQKLGYSSLKKEQLDIIVGFLNTIGMLLQYCRLDLGKHFVMLVFPWYLMAWTHYVINLL